MLECLWLLLYILASLFLLYILGLIIMKLKERSMYKQFSKTEKDKLIIHCFPKISVPNIATIVPWDLKIEMFCRMAKINYEKDPKNTFGPTGKTPWVTINGEHMGDSHRILEYLKKNFGVNFNTYYTEEQLAVARSVRIMLEERWYWAMVIWRWLRKNGKQQFYKDFHKLREAGCTPLWVIRQYFRYVLGNQILGHGIGRHSEEEQIQMHLGDLKTVSLILGNKKYILGDEPCEDDCAIFGQIAQAVWGLPTSPFEKFVEEEAPNLREYCSRIRDTFWTKEEWEADF